jgi:hypothetical protein
MAVTTKVTTRSPFDIRIPTTIPKGGPNFNRNPAEKPSSNPKMSSAAMEAAFNAENAARNGLDIPRPPVDWAKFGLDNTPGANFSLPDTKSFARGPASAYAGGAPPFSRSGPSTPMGNKPLQLTDQSRTINVAPEGAGGPGTASTGKYNPTGNLTESSRPVVLQGKGLSAAEAEQVAKTVASHGGEKGMVDLVHALFRNGGGAVANTVVGGALRFAGKAIPDLGIAAALWDAPDQIAKIIADHQETLGTGKVSEADRAALDAGPKVPMSNPSFPPANMSASSNDIIPPEAPQPVQAPPVPIQPQVPPQATSAPPPSASAPGGPPQAPTVAQPKPSILAAPTPSPAAASSANPANTPNASGPSNYSVYDKNSAEAQDFRRAFKEALVEKARSGNETFMWQGRAYTTKLKGK